VIKADSQPIGLITPTSTHFYPISLPTKESTMVFTISLTAKTLTKYTPLGCAEEMLNQTNAAAA